MARSRRRPAASGGPRRKGRRRAFFWLVVLAVFWVPAAQCLLLRVVDPYLTWTMVERSIGYAREKHRLRLPDQDWADLDEMPCTLPSLALTAEDSAFFQHHGFDVGAIREAWELNRSGKANGKVRGASTISQQVARNVFLWQERSWLRKGLEAWYTVWLELLVPKERILEVYLNVAETGPMVFGVAAGARHHYGKDLENLAPAEAAGIIAILPSPRRWSPKKGYGANRAAGLVGRPGALPRGFPCLR